MQLPKACTDSMSRAMHMQLSVSKQINKQIEQSISLLKSKIPSLLKT